MKVMTNHAFQQCHSRGIDPHKVISRVKRVSDIVKQHKSLMEVYVLVEKSTSGQWVVAAIDPKDIGIAPCVKTVFYREVWQIQWDLSDGRKTYVK